TANLSAMDVCQLKKSLHSLAVDQMQQNYPIRIHSMSLSLAADLQPEVPQSMLHAKESALESLLKTSAARYWIQLALRTSSVLIAQKDLNLQQIWKAM